MRYSNPYNAIAPQQAAREQEALTFRLTARKLREVTDRTSRNRALEITHTVWSHMFRDLSSSGNGLPEPLKSDCLKLAEWAMSYSTRAILLDLPLLPLIEVNDTVAEGLEAQTERSAVSSAPSSVSRPRVPVSAVPAPATSSGWTSGRMSA